MSYQTTRPAGPASRLERLAEKARTLQPVAPGLLDGFGDADARAGQHVGLTAARAQLERGFVQRTAVLRMRDAERLREPARARAQEAHVLRAAPPLHRGDPFRGLQGANQHGAR